MKGIEAAAPSARIRGRSLRAWRYLRLAGRTLGVSPRGHTGRGDIEPDEGSGRGRCRSRRARPAISTMTGDRHR